MRKLARYRLPKRAAQSATAPIGRHAYRGEKMGIQGNGPDIKPIVTTRTLYAIVDKVAVDVSGPIITARHDAEAMRLFNAMLQDQKTTIGYHPADHQLVRLGTFTLYPDCTYELTEAKGLLLDGATWLKMQEDAK